MVFHLNLRAGPSILRNLKTIPFLSKAIKTCIQLYKEFPDLKAKYGVRYSYYQSGWCGLERNVQDETVACSEKAGKKDLISLSLWKNGRGLLFWNDISLKNSLKTKQNWQYWIYCLRLFCLRRPLFAPLPWKLQGYLSLQPFYNNVPFLTKQQRKYQVKPLPPSNDQVNSASVLQTAHAHSHVCPHAATLLMRNVRSVSKISVFSACVCVCVVFFRLLVFLMVKEKGGDGFLFILRMLEGLKSGFRQKH